MDGDGLPDETANCPLVPNEDQADGDDDGIGDLCDATPQGPDDDGDGRLDATDNCVGTPNFDQLDNDGDGVGDACDNCVWDANPNQADADDDGDGLANFRDNCPWPAPRVALGSAGFECVVLERGDIDRDGVINEDDICPYFFNPEQDSQNACITDFDGDGVPNLDDICPNTPDPNQFIAQNGLGASCQVPVDRDRDTIIDVLDNCPFVANTDQVDDNGDFIGDACDDFLADTDGDGFSDATDRCMQWPSPANNPPCADFAAGDLDGDGVPNNQDTCVLIRNPLQRFDDECLDDFDGDGMMNSGDVCPLVADPEQNQVQPGMGAACSVPAPR